ncbi:lytic transglycosylase domain-containing protein [Egibacter rhizosphaerae]|uniref:Lytic transglycosylase domain-containing protein n=2 Tax=Egibacter rhizosphaerae TaxID=1670831 RepID=A0A411YLN2_9ACTN|nr:lytic transglycosylase domain-containing protein [Egibacter rhizosphaerae]
MVHSAGLPAWLDPDAPILGQGPTAPSLGGSGAADVLLERVRSGLAGAEGGQPTWVSAFGESAREWAPEISAAAAEAGIDDRLLAALVEAESGFRADAVSHAGAIGLAQLMPGTADALGVDPRDPVDNLRGGAQYLREQLDRFGSVEEALAAYNAGPHRVQQAGGIPNITETQNYVRTVTDRYAQL